MSESNIQNKTNKYSSWMPNIDELFQSVKKEFNSEGLVSDEIEFVSSEDQNDVLSATPYIQAAAVLSTYDPETIKPLKGLQNSFDESDAKERDWQIRFLLGCSTMVIKAAGGFEIQPRWSLRDEIRRKALAELEYSNRADEALNANAKNAFDSSDSEQKLLTAVLGRNLSPLQNLRLEQLVSLQRIEPWISELSLITNTDNTNFQRSAPTSQKIQHYIERERLLEPFRHLVGRWENGVFKEYFRGRKSELEKLRKYVNVAESESYFESVSRALDSASSYLFNLYERPPLVIHGPGGVGKSTLMAKFLLQHTEAQDQQQFPFVYVDFDHPDFGAGGLANLLAKISGQLASQFTMYSEEFNNLQRQVLEDSAQTPSLNYDYRLIAQKYTEKFSKIYSQAVGHNLPLLLVLDTFEEIQQSSRDQVRGIFEFLGWLQGVVPRLRSVIAGRAPVDEKDAGLAVENLPLPDLDSEAATGFLNSRGIKDDAVCKEIIELVGRHPLALKLAADLAQEHSLTDIREAAGGGIFARLKRAWTKTDITGRLYERLLNHITDPEIKKLAHPGLVLRRITAAIIQQVLAVPCQVNVGNEIEAQHLFERLRLQVSLVSPAEQGVLRHRTDVRRIMLPLILEDEKTSSAARQIQEKAVAFYEKQNGTAARAEEIYHRLLLGESPRTVENRWIDGLAAYFKEDTLDELPPKAQAFVAARINAERNDDIWKDADIEDWEIYAEQRIRRLLNKNEPERALAILDSHSTRTPNSRLHGLKALVLRALGRTKESSDAAKIAFKLCFENGRSSDLYNELSDLEPETLNVPAKQKEKKKLGK